uniref:Homeobox domain-containing protein n=1 Tax=Strongyloides papillosus TaxID=174720 RepID=A0A0N5BUN5_STREA
MLLLEILRNVIGNVKQFKVVFVKLNNLPYTLSQYNCLINEIPKRYRQKTSKQTISDKALAYYDPSTEMALPKFFQLHPTPYKKFSNQIQSPSDEVPSTSFSDGEKSSVTTTRLPQSTTPASCKRIIFNKMVEAPILERWYEKVLFSSKYQSNVIAEILKEATGRFQEKIVSVKKVYNWFTNKRYRGK